MNIDQLTYISEVARTGSFTIAAQNLHISISAISQSISNLEEEFGTKIFMRSRKGTTLTHKGKTIVDMSKDILIRLEKLKVEANSKVTQENFNIAAIPDCLNHLIPLTYEINHSIPNMNLEFSEKKAGDILNGVQLQKIDLGLISFHEDFNKLHDDLIFQPVINGKIKVYVSKDSPLASKSMVKPQELLDQNLVYYNGENVKLFVDDFFNKYGPMNVLFSSNLTQVIIHAVLEGKAISFAHEFAYTNMPYLLNGDIVSLDLMNHDAVNVSLGWVTSKSKNYSTNAKSVIDYIKSEFIATGLLK